MVPQHDQGVGYEFLVITFIAISSIQIAYQEGLSGLFDLIFYVMRYLQSDSVFQNDLNSDSEFCLFKIIEDLGQEMFTGSIQDGVKSTFWVEGVKMEIFTKKLQVQFSNYWNI